MSGKTITRYRVTCDGGCGKTRGDEGQFANAMEARAALYAAGWRFPPKIIRTGRVSPHHYSDVCPDCLPTFQEQPCRPATPSSGSGLTG